jgi:N-acetyl-alpha-D-muramate 1-phosphate uridylyltransferase
MILAAGRGERMRPLTDGMPKALLPAGGRALIEWHVLRLAAAGFRDVVVNHAWLGTMIEEALGDGARYGVRLRYSAEPVALETAGGIANALPLIDGAAFPVVNADVYCDYDYDRLAALAHQLAAAPERAGHLVLVDNPPHHPEGDFSLDGSRVGEAGAPRLTFSGIGIYRRELFAGLPRGAPARLAPLLRTAIARDRLSGERFTGRWVDVGTPDRLAELDRTLRLEGMRGC